MAAYTVLDGIHHVRLFIKNIPVSDAQLIIADEINSKMWRFYPWRWSTAAITPIALVDGTQDYTNAHTATYFRLVRARLARTDPTPDYYLEPLDILNKLEPNLITTDPTLIKAVSYEGHLTKFRLERAPTFNTNITYQLQGEYQLLVTKITNTSDNLPFPDQYFDVFVAGLKWRFMEFADDLRAGSSQSNKDKSSFSGAKADFYDGLMDMAAAEGYAAGDTVAPSEAFTWE